MRLRMFRLCASLFSASVLLLLLSSLLFTAAPARSSSASVSVPARTGIITDTRWIELIRSGETEPHAPSALPTINLHLTDFVVAGHTASAQPMHADVYRAGVSVGTAAMTPYPDGSGYFYAAQFSCMSASGGGYECSSPFKAGDVVVVFQATASVSLTVPALSGLVDVAHDQVYGSAPPSQTVTVYVYPFATPETAYTQTVNVDAAGRYQADYAATRNLRARDNGYVVYAEAPDRKIYARFAAPYLRAQVYDGSEMWGLAAPRSAVTITVADATGVPLWESLTGSGSDGAFYLGSQYGLQPLRPGDIISVSSAGQTFAITVLTITAEVDLARGQVHGQTIDGEAVEVVRYPGPLFDEWTYGLTSSPAEQVVVTATASGDYTASLALQRANYGAALVTSAEGYQTYALFATPYLSVRMAGEVSSSYLTGQIDDLAAPVTITLQGPSGYFKDIHHLRSSYNGYFAGFNSSVGLYPGDVVTMTTARGPQAALKLPTLTGQIDPVTDIVSGTAPPNTRLLVALYMIGAQSALGGGGPAYYPQFVVTATAQGDYVLDLHGVQDLGNYASGLVSLTTVEGHQVSRGISVSRSEECSYRLDFLTVGGNQFGVTGPETCRHIPGSIIRLRDAASRVKSEVMLSWSGTSVVGFYTQTRPVAILPGDIVEVEWNDAPPAVTLTPTAFPPTLPLDRLQTTAATHLISFVVPTLTVQLDPVAQQISGQAPANTIVTLYLYRGETMRGTLTTTVSTQGSYAVQLNESLALEQGDRALVLCNPIDSPAIQASGVLPNVGAQLYQPMAGGVLPPLTPFTLTLETTGLQSTRLVTGFAANDGLYGGYLELLQPGDTVALTTPQQVRRLTMPLLTAHVDRSTATVAGQTPSFARLRIAPYAGLSQIVTATASGAYSAAFPALAPLNTSSGVLTYFEADGDQAVLDFSTVHWEVAINDKCLKTQTDMIGTPATLTLRRADGALKSTVTFTPTFPPYSTCFDVPVHTTDRIQLQTVAATEIFTVPVLSAHHDYGRQTIEGQAPPQQEVLAETGSAPRHVYADETGHYGVDTSDWHPPLLTRGRVLIYDEAGNSTSYSFTVLGYPVYLPVVRR